MLDALELSSFYEEPMGQVTRRQIMRRIRLAWPDLRGLRVLGYGFAPPYLKACLPEAERAVAFIPNQLGAVAWPADRRLVAVGEEGALPFPDAFFDRVLMVHGLESAEATRPLMRQVWRVLAESGRLIVVAPNRTSLWAQVERSPFAYGRPFNRMQLETLLRRIPVHSRALGHRFVFSADPVAPARAKRNRVGAARQEIVAEARRRSHRRFIQIDVCARTK